MKIFEIILYIHSLCLDIQSCKSIKDPTADAVSAVLIYKGLKNCDGSNVDIEMIESELHVVTRLNGRDNITQHDRDIQTHVFEDMYKILMQ